MSDSGDHREVGSTAAGELALVLVIALINVAWVAGLVAYLR